MMDENKTGGLPDYDAVSGALIRPIQPWSTRDTVYAIATAVAAVIFVSLALFGGFHLGYTVSFVLLFVLFNLYLVKGQKKYTPFSVLCGVASVLLSVVFSIYDEVNFALFLTDLLLLWIFLSVSYVDGRRVITEALHTAIVTPFVNIGEPFRAFGQYNRDNNKKSPNRQILVGLAISVPILAVVLPLLISADAAFEGLMKSLFADCALVILKIVLGLLLAVYLFAKLFAVRNRLGTPQTAPGEDAVRKGFSPVTGATVLSVLSVLYFVYLLSQLAYFFSAFSGILPQDYTFTVADYARRGFFELCGVCCINLGLLALIIGFVKRRQEQKHYISVKITATLICVFSLVFVATAVSKMLLYIKSFGLTRLRLETSLLMVLMAVMFIGVLIFVFTRRFPMAKYAVVSVAVMALLVGFADVDRTVAEYNVRAYQEGILSEIDVAYLGALSDSAVPQLEKLMKSKDKEVKRAAQLELYRVAKRYYDITDTDIKEKNPSAWESDSYARTRAKRIVVSHKKLLLQIEKSPYSYQVTI